MRRIRDILPLIVIIAGIIGGCVAFEHRFGELTSPRPISAANQPEYFNVLAFSKSGKLVMLKSQISSAIKNHIDYCKNNETEGNIVLWDTENGLKGPYSFYLGKKKIPSLQKALYASIPGYNQGYLEHWEIKLLNDNPRAKTQKIYLHDIRKETDYYYIYSVKDNKIIPLEYGDCVKSDAIKAFSYAFVCIMIIYAAGLVSFTIVRRRTAVGS